MTLEIMIVFHIHIFMKRIDVKRIYSFQALTGGRQRRSNRLLTLGTFVVHLPLPGPNLSRKRLNLNIDKPRNIYMRKRQHSKRAIEIADQILIMAAELQQAVYGQAEADRPLASGGLRCLPGGNLSASKNSKNRSNLSKLGVKD